MGKGRSANDDRSDRYNPNNDAYWAAEANEAAQRGDDDWDDWYDVDAGSSPGWNPMSVSALVIDMGVAPGTSLDHYPSQDPPKSWQLDIRGRAGPLVIDRLSHVANLLRTLVQRGAELQAETPRSRSRRRDRLETIALLSELESMHAAGPIPRHQGTRIVGRMLELARWSKDDVNEGVRLAEVAWAQLQSSQTTRSPQERDSATAQDRGAYVLGSVPWSDVAGVRVGYTRNRYSIYLNDVPEQVWHDDDWEDEALGWHEIMSRSVNDLLRDLDAEPGDRLIHVRPRYELQHGRLSDPHGPDHEARRLWEFVGVACPTVHEALAALEQYTAPRQKPRYIDTRTQDPDRMSIVFPGTLGVLGSRVSVARYMRDVLGRLAAWLEPLDHRINPVPMIEAVVAAFIRAEWSSCSWVLLGSQFDPIGGVRLSALCASDTVEARDLHHNLTARGHRVVALPCPRLASPTRWHWTSPPKGSIGAWNKEPWEFQLCVPRIRGKRTMEALGR